MDLNASPSPEEDDQSYEEPIDVDFAQNEHVESAVEIMRRGRVNAQFPGSHPVSLNSENLQILRQRYYYATWKADGTRYMMLITRDGCFLIDRNFCFRRVQMRFPLRNLNEGFHHYTLIDGEMIVDTVPDLGLKRRYLAYDLMALHSHSKIKLLFSDRWKLLEDEIIRPLNHDKGQFDSGVKGSPSYRYDMELFSVRRKDFWPLSAVNKILKEFIPNLCHESDGLILQGWDDPYVTRTHEGLLKWKYPEMNSVDFLFEIGSEYCQLIFLYERGRKKLMDGARVVFPERHVFPFRLFHMQAHNIMVMRSITDNITEDKLLEEINEIRSLPMTRHQGTCLEEIVCHVVLLRMGYPGVRVVEDRRGYPDIHGGPLVRVAPRPHPAILEEEVEMQEVEYSSFMADHRALVDERLSLHQEFQAGKDEIRHLNMIIADISVKREAYISELVDKRKKLEAELRANESLRDEIVQLQGDIDKLLVVWKEFSAKATSIMLELTREKSAKQQIPMLKAEIDGLQQELVHARSACELEQKGNFELVEQRKAMEKSMVSMAQEIEQMRAELGNFDGRPWGPGGAYGMKLGSPEAFSAPYGDNYNIHVGASEKGPSHLLGSSSWVKNLGISLITFEISEAVKYVICWMVMSLVRFQPTYGPYKLGVWEEEREAGPYKLIEGTLKGDQECSFTKVIGGLTGEKDGVAESSAGIEEEDSGTVFLWTRAILDQGES
ncbi:hypothetical protein ABZP36_033816 [Zizania latifolia]